MYAVSSWHLVVCHQGYQHFNVPDVHRRHVQRSRSCQLYAVPCWNLLRAAGRYQRPELHQVCCWDVLVDTGRGGRLNVSAVSAGHVFGYGWRWEFGFVCVVWQWKV